MLAILPLQLSVESGTVRRAMQDEDVIPLQHRAHCRRVMLARAIEPAHEGRAMAGKVFSEYAGHGVPGVAAGFYADRPIGHRTIARYH